MAAQRHDSRCGVDFVAALEHNDRLREIDLWRASGTLFLAETFLDHPLSAKITRRRRSFPVHSWAEPAKISRREAEKHRYPRSNFYLLLMMHDHLVNFE